MHGHEDETMTEGVAIKAPGVIGSILVNRETLLLIAVFVAISMTLYLGYLHYKNVQLQASRHNKYMIEITRNTVRLDKLNDQVKGIIEDQRTTDNWAQHVQKSLNAVKKPVILSEKELSVELVDELSELQPGDEDLKASADEE